MMASLSRCGCANIRSHSPSNITLSAVEFTIRCLTISSRDWNRQSGNALTVQAFNEVTSLRDTQDSNLSKAHREQRRHDCASTQQHECGTIGSETILHCADDCRTD